MHSRNGNMRKEGLLRVSTILIGATLTPMATAQDRPQSAGAPTQLEEIVVTAQRRSESLQRAAVSVQAISSEALTNAGMGTSPADLTRLIPAAQFQNESSIYPQVTIRGVGNYVANPQTEATVGVNYDGVPITHQANTLGIYYDLERIEVLKGPQGTLYGRNNTGGSVNVLPAHPVVGKYSGGATVSAGNHELLQGTGYLNIPLGDRAALRASFNVIDREGFYNNGQSDDVGQSARLQVRLEPTDTLNINFGVDYHHQGGQGPGITLLQTTGVISPSPLQQYASTDGRPLGDAWHELNTQCDGVADGTQPFDFDDFGSPCRYDADRDDKFYGVTATINWTSDWGTLTVVPAYRGADLNSLVTGIPVAGYDETDKTKSLEARFASDDSQRFNYIVGAYVLDDSIDVIFTGALGIVDFLQPIEASTQSQAVFATARYSFTDTLRASMGARYTHDDKEMEGISYVFGIPFFSLDRGNTWNELTYRGGVEFDVAPESMLYLNYERGYKAGGFFFASEAVAPPVQTFDPEYVDAITLGSRNRFLDRRLQLNAELFNYRYKDKQVSGAIDDPGSPTGFTFGTRNLGKVDILGAEIETQFYVTPTTLLTADFQYLDAEIKRAGSSTTTPMVTLDDIVGEAPTLSPRETARVGVQQTFAVGSNGEIVANISGYYRSAMWAGTDYLPYQRVDSITTGDASLGYRRETWSVTAFVNNFTDKDVVAYVGGTGEFGLAPQPAYKTYAAPRTYGVRLSANF
jgi:iron complex outermembrane recepter protein